MLATDTAQSAGRVPTIKLQRVARSDGYGESEVIALDNIDFTVQQGEFVALMGPSDAGKSICMNELGCLDRPTSGHYFFQGVDVAYLSGEQRALLRRYLIGFVFKGFNLPNRTTALENVELPLIYRRVPAKERHCRAREALANVGLSGREEHTSGGLSGGQQQPPGAERRCLQSGSAIRQFTRRDFDAVENNIFGIEGVSPTAGKQVTIVQGNKNWSTSVTGITVKYFPVRNANVIRGNAFSEQH